MLSDNHQIIQHQHKPSSSTVLHAGSPAACPDPESLESLHTQSRRGLWGLFIYLSASVLAFYFRDQSLATVLSPAVMLKLGPVPPVFMATIVLWISTFSALIIIAGRLYHGTRPSSTTSHIAFRIGIYLLYFMVGGLDQHINAIFISGLVVMALQHHNVMGYYSSLIEVQGVLCSALDEGSLSSPQE